MYNETAVFDKYIESDGDTVIREGLVFEAGDYPDRAFSMSEDELAEAARMFEPVDLCLQHVRTPLDGKLGSVIGLRAEGCKLFGRVRVPKWLDKLLPDKKVSCAWDRATKRLRELSLVTDPRIANAALYAAGIETESQEDGLEHNNTVTLKDWLTRLRALFSDLPDGESSSDRSARPVSAAADGDNEMDRLRAEFAGLQCRQRVADASTFADEQINAGRALPSERTALVATFTQAAQDDAEHPRPAEFATDGNSTPAPTRVDLLRALFAARPAHRLTTEVLQSLPLRTLSDVHASDASVRRTELLNQTRLGQEVLHREHAG